MRRDQIQGWKLPDGIELDADDVRLVLGELLNPSYDERNVAGIVKALRAAAASDPDPAKVEAALQILKQADGKPLQVWEAPWTDNHNDKLYTLVSRKPNVVDGVLGGRLGWNFFQAEGRSAWPQKFAVSMIQYGAEPAAVPLGHA